MELSYLRSLQPLSWHFKEPEGSLPCSQGLPLVPILSQKDPVHILPL